jgi:exosortase
VTCVSLVVVALACFGASIIYASALGWTHAMAEFLLAAALVSALGAAWLGFADRRVRFVPFSWAAAVSIALWIFASPPPPGSYARLTFFLQNRVTEGVVRIMGAVGIAAFQDGNVIELARTSVGVSEACSGVRSLISCTVAGLFLSALLVRTTRNRVLLVAVSPAIGLGMNFVRSLLLTLLANAGVNIEGRWHDLTGASILVVTTILVAGFGLWLHRGERAGAASGGVEAAPPAGTSPLPAAVAIGLVVAALGASLVAFSTKDPGAPAGPDPDLEALLPAPPAGWTSADTPGMDRFSDTLRTHALVERVYSAGPGLDSSHVTLYLAYWRPGQAPVSLVDAHTPDACWPGTGWVSIPVPAERETLSISGRRLPPAECRLFARSAFKTHVWYWHLYGGRPLAYVDPYSAVRLLKLSLRYGFRRAEDQLFVRVSTNRPWEEVAALPAFQRYFEGLRPLGL